MQRDMDDVVIHEVYSVISVAHAENQGEMSLIMHVQSTNWWSDFRDTKAIEMFVDYQARHGQSSVSESVE
jgi:hypothetical protein